MNNLYDDNFTQEWWFNYRDLIYEVGRPNFSIVSNDEDENPDQNIIRITDCKFNVFIDVIGSDRQDSIERANALCKVLNIDYPFMTGKSPNETQV